MSAPSTVRDARPDELAALAPALAALPLMVRYGTSGAALARSLSAAHDRGEGLVVVEAGGSGAGPRGLAWFQTRGTLALGGYLRLIAIVPGHEGQGMGAALLREVERRTAAESRHLFLLCDSANEAALRFYARQGYRTAGSLPDLVRPTITEVLLHKALG